MSDTPARTPFAYSVILEYDGSADVYPPLAALVAALRKSDIVNPGWCATTEFVTAHYADGVTDPLSVLLSLRDWVDERPVDRDEVARHIDQLREESRKNWEEMWARMPKGSSITGSAPLHELNRNDLINREVERRRWVWKEIAS